MTWEEINRKRLPFIRFGENLFKRMYGEIRKSYISIIKDAQTAEEINQLAESFRFNENIVRVNYERFYLKTGLSYARNIQKSYNKRLELKDINEDILEEVWYTQIMEFVKNKVGNNISSVIKTHYADIQRITKNAVKAGIDKGWGMDKIARKIMLDQQDIEHWKAMRIARTEVVSASNEGVKVGYEQLPGNKEKVWISTFKQTSRPDHMEMDGVRVPYNELFTLSNGHQLEYPCDPDPAHGDAGDKINCGCGYDILVIPEMY